MKYVNEHHTLKLLKKYLQESKKKINDEEINNIDKYLNKDKSNNEILDILNINYSNSLNEVEVYFSYSSKKTLLKKIEHMKPYKLTQPKEMIKRIYGKNLDQKLHGYGYNEAKKLKLVA